MNWHTLPFPHTIEGMAKQEKMVRVGRVRAKNHGDYKAVNTVLGALGLGYGDWLLKTIALWERASHIDLLQELTIEMKIRLTTAHGAKAGLWGNSASRLVLATFIPPDWFSDVWVRMQRPYEMIGNEEMGVIAFGARVSETDKGRLYQAVQNFSWSLQEDRRTVGSLGGFIRQAFYQQAAALDAMGLGDVRVSPYKLPDGLPMPDVTLLEQLAGVGGIDNGVIQEMVNMLG